MHINKVAIVALLAATPSEAAIISQTFSFNAINFTPASPSTPPDPFLALVGDFTVQYDRSIFTPKKHRPLLATSIFLTQGH